MTMPPASRPERPGLFVAAVLFHVIEGFVTVVFGTFGILALAFAGAIVAANARGDDAWVAVVAILAVMGLVAFATGLGLIALFLAYKAWSLERVWVIALIAFSVLTVVAEPCGILVAVLTAIGGMQVLDAQKHGAPPTV